MPFLYPTVPSLQVLADMLAVVAPEGPIDRVQIERSDTGGGVGYANVGTKTLVPGTLTYTFSDVNGGNADWYRWYFSNAANTYPIEAERGYSPEIQPGAPGAGLVCELGDVKQRLKIAASDTTDDEFLIQLIGMVSAEVMGYTGRRFARNPSSGTAVFVEDVPYGGYEFRIPAGIATLTVLEVATSSQPATGGTYETVPAAEWLLRPVQQRRSFGWPATSIVISDTSGSIFTAGRNTLRWTGAGGFESVPADVRGIGERAVIRNFQARQSGQADLVGSSEFGTRILRMLSPEETQRLDWYRHIEIV